nr:MAG TPA: hypothetical protein [Caudoviricetes sp.]
MEKEKKIQRASLDFKFSTKMGSWFMMHLNSI